MVAEIAARRSAIKLRNNQTTNDPYPSFCWDHSLQKHFVVLLNRNHKLEENTSKNRDKYGGY
jgi:hypothetical protein